MTVSPKERRVTRITALLGTTMGRLRERVGADGS